MLIYVGFSVNIFFSKLCKVMAEPLKLVIRSDCVQIGLDKYLVAPVKVGQLPSLSLLMLVMLLYIYLFLAVKETFD